MRHDVGADAGGWRSSVAARPAPTHLDLFFYLICCSFLDNIRSC
jgi:hypothetical protein